MLKLSRTAFAALVLYATTGLSALAQEDHRTLRATGIDGQSSCINFFSYIKTHPNMPDTVNAENAKFVMMLIITSQRKNSSFHRNGDEMTPARMHDYEHAFADDCRALPESDISSAMTHAVARVDEKDPL